MRRGGEGRGGEKKGKNFSSLPLPAKQFTLFNLAFVACIFGSSVPLRTYFHIITEKDKVGRRRKNRGKEEGEGKGEKEEEKGQ